MKANNGPAMQGTGRITYKSFSLGLWSSSVNFGDDVESETDPFIEITLRTGDISVSSPSLKIVDLSAVVGFGTYSSRWIPAGPRKDAVGFLLLGVGK